MPSSSEATLALLSSIQATRRFALTAPSTPSQSWRSASAVGAGRDAEEAADAAGARGAGAVDWPDGADCVGWGDLTRARAGSSGAWAAVAGDAARAGSGSPGTG